jgi:hypothetical protein
MKSNEPLCFFISSAFLESDHLVGAQPQRVLVLFGEVVKTTVCAPSAWANFTPMWPSPPRPTTPDFLALADLPVAHGRVGGDAGAQQRRGGGEVEVGRNFRTNRSSTTMLSEYPP